MNIRLLESLPPKAARIYRLASETLDPKRRLDLLSDCQDALVTENPSGQLFGADGPYTMLGREKVPCLKALVRKQVAS